MSMLVVVLPLAIGLGILRIQRKAAWHPHHTLVALNEADVATLVTLALAVALPVVLLQRKIGRQLRVKEHREQQVEAIRTENDAVARVCAAVAREFAQPLTGALAYSELLLMDSQSPSESQRRALEGLCEGVTRLEQLLYSVRDAVQDVPSPWHGEHVADIVVHAVGRPVLRWQTRDQDRDRPLAHTC